MKKLLYTVDMGIRHDTLPMHDHAYDELYVSLAGRAMNVIDGETHETLPLDVFVLTRETKHAQPLALDYQYCLFKFDRAVLQEMTEHMHLGQQFDELFSSAPRSGAANLRIDPLSMEYVTKTAMLLSREADEELQSTLFIAMLSVICKHARGKTESRASRAAAEIAAYLETHFAAEIDLDLLAAQCHYSKRHLARIFDASYGMSPIAYLDRIRLRHAAELLVSTDAPVGEIAEKCGFTDGSMFTKHFAAQFGKTPSRYRHPA